MLAVLKLPLTLIWTVPMLSTVAKTLLRWGIVRAVRAIQPWTFAAVIRAATAVILRDGILRLTVAPILLDALGPSRSVIQFSAVSGCSLSSTWRRADVQPQALRDALAPRANMNRTSFPF
jgi:hypothetical protein